LWTYPTATSKISSHDDPILWPFYSQRAIAIFLAFALALARAFAATHAGILTEKAEKAEKAPS
jgi:hypothetical protein